MPTIGRNRRQYLANVKALYTECLRFNHRTGTREPCDPDAAWDLLLSTANKRARLTENDDKTIYTISDPYMCYELRRPV